MSAGVDRCVCVCVELFFQPPRLPLAPNPPILAPNPYPEAQPQHRGSGLGSRQRLHKGAGGGRNRPGEEGSLCVPPHIYSPLETKAASAAGMRLAWLLPGLFSRLMFGFDALQERCLSAVLAGLLARGAKVCPERSKTRRKHSPGALPACPGPGGMVLWGWAQCSPLPGFGVG